MSAHLTEEEHDYSSRLYKLILDQVIGMDSVADGKAGAVRPHIVRMVMMDVAATIDFNAGLGRVPSERRKTGEDLGKRYAALLRSLTDSNDGSWKGAAQVVDPETSGKPN